MGYLDYAGLQYLWGKLKEKFAPKSHSHDDRYYTESEMDGKLNSKVDNTETGANGLLSKLTTSWTATPTDNTYFIRQDTGGGNSFGRVKFSTLWNYIKGKADGTYQPKGSYAASSHTHDDRYYTETEINSKLNGKAVNITLSKVDLNTVKTPGFYNAGGGNGCTNVPVSDAFGLIVTHNANGEYYTQIFFLVDKNTSYRRYCNGGTWSGWTQDKFTDTNTWRGIQNNLTSDSTTDSLSAAQGKALKTLVDGKAATGHTHNSIKDAGDSRALTFAYSKEGLPYGNYSWLAGWNGSELRAVDKKQFATAEHTHSSIVGHTAGNGFDFGYSNSKDVTIPKETAVSTYYVKVLSSTPFDFRFKKMYVKTVGDNTQYSFIAQISANAYMPPHIELITQHYNSPEIKNIIVASAPNYYHSIYLEIDSSTKVEKTISIQSDFSTDSSLSLSKTKPSDIQLTVPIRSNDHISTSIPICADGGIYGNLNGKATSAGTADVANSIDWSKVQNKPSTFTPAGHTHTKDQVGLGNVDNTADANKSVKYATSAGNASKVNNHTVGIDVPSNAKFTDTNTWRPVVNDLTSTATDQSLSAAMGKKLNDEKAPASGSNNYVRVWNSGTVGGVDNASLNDLAKQHFAMAMVNNATDNPTGGKNWIHAISMNWNDGNNAAWVSQLALGVSSSNGMWYRTTGGNIVGTAWKRVLDSSNYSGYALPLSGGTMTGALNFANGTWNVVGDDVRFGDNNTSGSFYIQGLNGPTNIKLKKKGDTSTGSGDSATITYDGGNLVIDKTIQANLSGTADNATKLGGLSPSKDGDKAVWGTVPTVSSNTGVTELGKYLDFHSTKDSSVDYDARITAETTGLTITGTTKGTFSGNLTGNASTATSATSATTASHVGLGGDVKNPMTFNWSGQSGQPSWLWGSNNGTDVMVWNPANFNVNSAKTATSATRATTADKADKLTTARTVSGGSDITLSFNYDGSGNSTANIGFYSCNHYVGNTNNYPFHRFAKLENLTGAYTDKTMTVYITQDYSGGGFGICRLSLRTNNSSTASSVEAKWLVRCGLSADFVQVAIYNVYGKTYADAFIKTNGGWACTTISALESGTRGSKERTWTLVNSNEVDGTTVTDKKTSSECWKTIADAGNELHKQAYSSSAPAIDGGYVASAGSANTASIATTGVQDYNASNRTIKIGYAGTGLTKDNLTHVAGYTEDGNKIKDVSKDVLQSWLGLGASAYKKVQSLSAVGHSDWKNQSTDDSFVPTMAFMAYWNGAFNSNGSSNLQYCDRGRFGTIVTKNSGDYASAGHTHNYAGSGSAGGSANSAVKLDSSAGSNTQPVYFSGGKPVAIGYTIASSVPANAKFTDTTYGVATASSNGLMSSTDKTKLDDFSRVISIQKQIKLTTDWQDVGIAGNSLETGTYVVQVSGFNPEYTQIWREIYSGVMSWYSDATNSGNASEIFLHNAGHADNSNAIYLRTLRTAGQGPLKLQIACKTAATGTDTLTFKFRRLI